jgi:hypothetical protein
MTVDSMTAPHSSRSNHSAIEPGGWPAEQVAPFEGRDPYSYVATPAASKL